jgi:hypothetical protein
MLDSFLFYGGVAAIILLAIISSVFLMRYRKATGKIIKSGEMMESYVYKAVAEKYGVGPNLIVESLAPDGDAFVGAMTRCENCGSVEECRHFFNQPGGDVEETREFCPNADLFIGLAKKLPQEANG